MTKPGRRALIGAGILAATVLVVALCVQMLVDVDRYKPAIEEACSRSLTMACEIRGKAALQLVPLPRLGLRDIHLTKGTSEVLSAKEARLSPRWIPLILHRRLSIGRLTLQKPKIRIERRIVIPRLRTLRSVAVHDGDFVYRDRSSGKSIEIGGLDVSLSRISWGETEQASSPVELKALSFRGKLHARTVQVGTLHASHVRCRFEAEAGLLRVDPSEVTLFGARSRGSLTLDLRGGSPRIQATQAASRIELGRVFSREQQVVSGTVRASVEAEGTGGGLSAIRRTLRGHVSIRGEHLSIHGWDIDRLIDDYNRTQKFDFIDLGAVVVAGPLGPLLTRGLDVARLYGGMGHGSSEILKLASDWEIVDGIATASDVAFSTAKNTVAFRGAVSLVSDSLENFFVATVDQHGCAQVKQQITGSFAHPQAPGLASKSIFGAIGSAIGGVLDLGKPDQCELFYSGSALP